MMGAANLPQGPAAGNTGGGGLGGNKVTDSTSNISAEAPAGSATPGGAGALEDAILLKRCRDGEMDAFAALIRKYQDRVYNGILRMCGNPDDAEELCQETFVKALENLATFRAESGFYTWVFRIGMNLTISHRRRAGRVKFHSLGAAAGDEESNRSRDLPADRRQRDPAEIVAEDEPNRRVLEALAELDDEFRAVIVLREMEEMDYGQISQALSIPVGTVKSRLYRARCLLQESLRDLIA